MKLYPTMKLYKTFIWIALVALLLGAVSLATAAPPAQDPAPQTAEDASEGNPGASLAAPVDIKNVGSSHVVNVSPALLPIDTSFDLCFTVLVQSPDDEYLDRFHADLPDGWTVNSVAPNSVPPANGCASGLPPVTGVSAGNIVFWQSSGYPPATGCGAWRARPAGANFDFCTNVTIPDRVGAPWTLPWSYAGDVYGAPPHEVSGSYGPIAAVEKIMLTPEQNEADCCACDMRGHDLTLYNGTGSSVFVNLSYTIVSGAGDCDGPASFFMPNGSSQTFTFDVLPVGDPGDTFVCQVTAADAANPGNSDISWITRHIKSRIFDPAGWQLEPVSGATITYSAGGVVGTYPSAAGPVGYLVGGWLGLVDVNPDLQMFDPATGSWTQLADLPNPRHSSVVGWIDDRLYVAGGFTWSYDSTDDLQVYHPAAGTWNNTTPANLPVMRGGGAGGVGTCSSGNGQCLFHVGGGSDAYYSSMRLDTWQYDPTQNAWTQLDDKPAGSSADGFVLGAGVGCLGQVYVGGDWRGFHEFYRLDATQPAGSQWTQLANIPPAAGVQMPALVCKEDWGALVLTGGDPDGLWETPNNTTYVYDIANDTWEGPLPQTLSTGQIGATGWHLAGKVWTVGGASFATPISPLPFESLAQLTCDSRACSQWLDAGIQAPDRAVNGELLPYAITVEPHLAAPMFMTDPLPAGVSYAGNLAWSAGNAWFDGGTNTVYWEYTPLTAAKSSGYVSQAGPEISRSIEEDGGSTLLDGPPTGVTGPISLDGYAWTVRAAPPTAVSRPAGAVDAAGSFYIIGGEPWAGQVQRYDPAAGTWDNSLALMPVAASNICAAVLGDDIYIPGGRDSAMALTQLQVYHTGSNTWDIITSDPLPAARMGAACTAYQGRLYLFGGEADTIQHNTAWMYDPAAPAGSRWTTSLAPAPVAGSYGAALAVGDLIFYAGMRDTVTIDMPYVYAYDPSADTWITYPNLTTARSGAGMWSIGDRLLVGGGGWTSSLTSVEQYDTTQGASGDWTAFEASLVQGRRTFAYASDPVHGRLFAANGWAGGYLAELEQLEFELVPEPIQITFDVQVTGHWGDQIINQGIASVAGIVQEFSVRTVVGGEALLTVAPPNLQASLYPNTTGNETLSICNQGDRPLSWRAYEQTPPYMLAGSMPFVPVDVAARGPVPEGKTLTSPGSTFLARPIVSTEPGAALWDQPLSTVDQDALLSLHLLDNPSFSSFVADDFTNTEPWLVNTIFIPGRGWSGFTGLWNATVLTWQIYADDGGVPAGDPSGAGDPPLWTLTLPPTDPHVVITSGSHNPAANVMLYTPEPLILPPGHYWLVFYPTSEAGTLGFYGRQLADTSNGSVAQFVNPGGGWGRGSDWKEWTFLMSLPDAAFRLEGSVLPQPEQIPWLSLSASSGAVPAGQCQPVDVTFNAAGLSLGDYEGSLLLLSNDLGAPEANIPVLLTVERFAGKVYLPGVMKSPAKASDRTFLPVRR